AGTGSEIRRRRLVAGLLEQATAAEQEFLARLLLGEVRHGALEGVVADAIGVAALVPADEVRRALMYGGDLGEVAVAAMGGGLESLRGFRLRLFRPVQPMLAQSAPDVAAALEATGPAAAEYKYDGARIQVHRKGGQVAVFTRSLSEVTDRMPEVVAAVKRAKATSLVLDGEAVVMGHDGRPRPFQETAGRFGSAAGAAAQLTPIFFDLLYLNGKDLTGLPESGRHRALAGALPPDLVVPRIADADADAIEEFMAESLERGHEGVVVKSIDAPYQAGRRGAAWVKVKPVHTLDLVVLAAEWGHGRRQGLLSNLHLGARDPGSGGFVMLGKTFKGLTDEMLGWQTRRFLELETGRDGNTVIVRPEQVVEVAFDGVQASTRYPGGVALRFARVRGYRDDKAASEADTIETVRDIHRGAGRSAP
ncbi:MAG: ATP-dependent DNA ligase, partial [Acidimicrobiia bacterium]|nr:ATP-dependent DNA ligase [Acidimicrobiia bacterium]